MPLFAAEGDDERPLSSAPERSYCRHDRAQLDEEARRVHCRDCGCELEAFAVLLQLARASERYIRQRDHAAREARQVQQRVQDLKRQERNAKARLRRLKGGA